ncbi:MAG: SDR family NAD(P)-dependent oxidoreductase [Vicingaceae bacterium]
MKTVITGSSKGLGFEIAKIFLDDGMDVHITSRKKSSLEGALNELKKRDPKGYLTGTAVDLSVSESIGHFCDSIKNQGDDIDILVNNVGTYSEDDIHSLSIETIDELMKINLYSAVRMTKELMPSIIRKKGFVVNIISAAALQPRTDALAYSISKGALKIFSDATRESLRAEGVKVIAVYPGAMNTSSWDGIEVDRDSLIQPKDVAKLILNAVQLSPNTLVEEIIINPNSAF